MILAAGLGERMRPLTDHTPKPLLVVGGKPLIVWQIERLRDAGFSDLVINHAHLGAQLEAALEDGHRYGVQIAWSREKAPLETAGGIATALPLLGEQPFLVCNGDVYSTFAYARLHAVLQDMHAQAGRLAHLVLVDNPPHHPTGDFALSAERVAFPGETGTPRLTFSGMGCYCTSLFAGILPGTPAKLAPLLKAAMSQGQVSGEYFSGRWEDVGTPARLQALDQELQHAT